MRWKVGSHPWSRPKRGATFANNKFVRPYFNLSLVSQNVTDLRNFTGAVMWSTLWLIVVDLFWVTQMCRELVAAAQAVGCVSEFCLWAR